MCARRHSADDDREQPPCLADALARWDTEQGWMRSNPVGGPTAEHVEPLESAPARYSTPGLPPPPPTSDSWEAVLSAEPPPPRSTDPWATPAPGLDDPEQELWTPPEDPIHRATPGAEADPQPSGWPGSPAWPGSPDPVDRQRPAAGGPPTDLPSEPVGWPRPADQPAGSPGWQGSTDGRHGSVDGPAGWPGSADGPNGAPGAAGPRSSGIAGWPSQQVPAPSGWSPAAEDPAGAPSPPSAPTPEDAAARRWSSPDPEPASWTAPGTAADSFSWSAPDEPAVPTVPSPDLSDDEWLAQLRGAGPDDGQDDRPDWARRPFGAATDEDVPQSTGPNATPASDARWSAGSGSSETGSWPSSDRPTPDTVASGGIPAPGGTPAGPVSSGDAAASDRLGAPTDRPPHPDDRSAGGAQPTGHHLGPRLTAYRPSFTQLPTAAGRADVPAGPGRSDTLGGTGRPDALSGAGLPAGSREPPAGAGNEPTRFGVPAGAGAGPARFDVPAGAGAGPTRFDVPAGAGPTGAEVPAGAGTGPARFDVRAGAGAGPTRSDAPAGAGTGPTGADVRAGAGTGPARFGVPAGAGAWSTRADIPTGAGRAEIPAGPPAGSADRPPAEWPAPGRPHQGRYGSLSSAEPPVLGGRYVRRSTGEHPTLAGAQVPPAPSSAWPPPDAGTPFGNDPGRPPQGPSGSQGTDRPDSGSAAGRPGQDTPQSADDGGSEPVPSWDDQPRTDSQAAVQPGPEEWPTDDEPAGGSGWSDDDFGRPGPATDDRWPESASGAHPDRSDDLGHPTGSQPAADGSPDRIDPLSEHSKNSARGDDVNGPRDDLGLLEDGLSDASRSAEAVGRAEDGSDGAGRSGEAIGRAEDGPDDDRPDGAQGAHSWSDDPAGSADADDVPDAVEDPAHRAAAPASAEDAGMRWSAPGWDPPAPAPGPAQVSFPLPSAPAQDDRPAAASLGASPGGPVPSDPTWTGSISGQPSDRFSFPPAGGPESGRPTGRTPAAPYPGAPTQDDGSGRPVQPYGYPDPAGRYAPAGGRSSGRPGESERFGPSAPPAQPADDRSGSQERQGGSGFADQRGGVDRGPESPDQRGGVDRQGGPGFQDQRGGADDRQGGPGPIERQAGSGPSNQPGTPASYDWPGAAGPYGQPRTPGPSDQPAAPGPYDRPGTPGPYDQPATSGQHDQRGAPGPFNQAGAPGSYDQGGPGSYDQPGAPGPYAQPGAPGYGQQGPPGQYEPHGATVAPPPTADQLTAQSLLRQRRATPQTGWRRAVYNISAHTVNPGQSSDDRRRQELIARASVPVPGCYRIAVISLKGGVGKTTTTVTLGATLASLRGDRVIAVDANPDRGTLSGKIPLETVATVRNLLNDVDSIQHYFDVRRYTSQSADRLEVLASESDPAVSTAFSESDYRTVASVLERFYNIVLTDCGTGLLHSAMAGVLDLADQIVLVSSGSVDGARSASATLDWLEAHGRGALVRNSVAVINSVRPKSGGVDLDRLEAHFAARCRAVTRIPYDPHLEEGAEVDLGELSPPSRAALLELAAAVADAFPREPGPYRVPQQPEA